MKITFNKLLTIITLISIVTGVLGAISFIYYKNKSHQEFEEAQKMNQQGEPIPTGFHLSITPKKTDTVAGKTTVITVALLDGKNTAVKADSDLVITVRPTPTSQSFRYAGVKGATVVIPKDSISTTLTYTETKSGKYSVIFYADGFFEGTAEMNIAPDDASVLTINAPSSTTLDQMSQGITLSATAVDKYKNKISEGFLWTVNKNGDGANNAGDTAQIVYSDPSAASCDHYVVTVSLGDLSKSAIITSKESGDGC